MDNLKVDLSTCLGKINLKNPVLVASGTFGFGEEYHSLIDLNKLGGIITKTVTFKPLPGNPPPRLAETSAGLLNSIGLENPGVDRFISEKLPFLQKIESFIVVSIGGESEEEYCMVAKKLSQAQGIDALEINVSCPNVKQGGYILGKSAKNVFGIVNKLKNVTSLPLIVKLTPEVSDIVEIAEAALQAGAEAISLINTLPGMTIDVNTWRPKLGGITGGLSGPAIKPVAVKTVWEVYQKLKCPIVGMGGIMNFEDALEFVLAGASAIAVGTANLIDPQISIDIIEKLERYLVKQKIKKFSFLIGKVKTA